MIFLAVLVVLVAATVAAITGWGVADTRDPEHNLTRPPRRPRPDEARLGWERD